MQPEEKEEEEECGGKENVVPAPAADQSSSKPPSDFFLMVRAPTANRHAAYKEVLEPLPDSEVFPVVWCLTSCCLVQMRNKSIVPPNKGRKTYPQGRPGKVQAWLQSCRRSATFMDAV